MKKTLVLFYLIPGLSVIAQNPKPSGAPPSASISPNQLLWYKGKKINDSSILTSKGTLVTYSQKNGIVTVKLTANQLRLMNRVKNEIEMTEPRKKQIYDIMALRKSNVMLYPHIQTILKDQDNIQDGYDRLLNNTIKLPVDADDLFIKHIGTSLPDSITGLAQQIEKMKIEAEKWGLIYQNPPAIDISICFPCDSILRKKNDEDVQSYIVMFYGKEAEIGRKTLQLSNRIALFINKKQYFPGSPQFKALQEIQAKINETQQWVLSRLQKKVFLLAEKFGKDVSKIELVILAIITYNRQVQLMSADNSPVFDKLLQILIENIQEVDKYLEDQMDKKNYGIVLSGTTLVIRIERLKQMLGIESDENFTENIKKIKQKIYAFNRFKIDMQIDYKGMWGDCGNLKINEEAFATTSHEIYLSLGLVDCRYGLFLANDHFEEYPNYHFGKRYLVPLEVRHGSTMEVKPPPDDGGACETVTHNLGGLHINPRGPFVTMSFCKDDVPDTLVLTDLHLPASRENRVDNRYAYWHFTAFNGYMRNPRPGWVEVPEDLAIQFDQLQNIEPIKDEKPSQEQMEKHYFHAIYREYLLKKKNEYDEQDNLSSTLFDAKNGDEVLIDEFVTKKYNQSIDGPGFGEATFKVKIKVTHAPLNYKGEHQIKK